MQHWTIEALSNTIETFTALTMKQQQSILALMTSFYPPPVYEAHRLKRRSALAQSTRTRELLARGTQHFPPFITSDSLSAKAEALKGFSVVFTAGGEGERLRISLQKRGVPESALADFTKATFGLPDFAGNPGTLRINLLMVAALCRRTGIDIPVVITTGPAGSVTAEVIPSLVQKHDNFGLRYLRIVEQSERLFLTIEEKIVLQHTANGLTPVTHPDETGGPIMKLKLPTGTTSNESILDWMSSLGCSKTIIVQATALYDQSLLSLMAAALGTHDCLGVGILRDVFPASDPYGTYVSVTCKGKTTLQIIEQDIRNDATRSITDDSHRWFLPFNTGFYAFENKLLAQHDLPDFATPPKELRPDLPRAPKIGYAATDLIGLAENPIILTIAPSLFGVLKNADDLEKLSVLGKSFGLDRLFEEISGTDPEKPGCCT